MCRAPHDGEGWSTWTEATAWLLRGRTVRTAGPIALVVGTLLAVVNQGGLVLAGEADGATWVRVGVDYLVPFAVASAGWLSARRAPRRPAPDAAADDAGTSGASEASDRP